MLFGLCCFLQTNDLLWWVTLTLTTLKCINTLIICMYHCCIIIIYMFGITQLISTSTRFTSATSIILDVILISDRPKIPLCGVLDFDLNDCQIIMFTLMQENPQQSSQRCDIEIAKHCSKEVFEEKLPIPLES